LVNKKIGKVEEGNQYNNIGLGLLELDGVRQAGITIIMY
jgi:hypothetical protein